MSDNVTPEEALEEAKETLELERTHRLGWIVGLAVSAPTAFILIRLANSTVGGAGEAYGLISAPFAIEAIVSIVAVLLLTFGTLPASRQDVRRCQRDYDRNLVREAGL